MNLSSLKLQLQPIAEKLRPVLKHILFITVLASLLFLVFIAFSISSILSKPSDQDYRLQQSQKLTQTKFDEATIQEVMGLKLSNGTKITFDDFSVQRTRVNPFTE